MKAIKFLILSAIAISLYSCDKKVENLLDIKFDTPSQSFELTVDTTSLTGNAILAPDTLDLIDLDSLAKKNGTSISKLKSVKVKTLTIAIVDPTDANFDNVDSCSVEVENPGLNNKVKLASIGNLAKGVNTVNLTPLDINILDYAKQDKLILTAKIKTNAGVTKKTKLKVTIVGEAIANPTN